MALNARKVKNTGGGKTYPPIDEGAYPARLVQVIDLGVQPQEFKGEQKAPKQEIHTTYELVDEFLPGEDGEPDETKPRWLSESFPLNNLDSDLAKSTKRYYALDPNESEEGDWPALIGNPVLVSVIRKRNSKGDENNYISGTGAVRPKDAARYPDLVNTPKVFLMDDPDLEVFLSLPQWLQDKIKSALNYEGSALEEALANHSPDKKEEKKTTKKAAKAKVEEEPEESEVEEDDVPW